MRPFLTHTGILTLVSLFTLGVVAPAFAWDVAIGTGFLDGALYVGSGSGAAPTWTTVDERVRASDVPGATVPISWSTQSWNPVAGEWPSDFIEAEEGVTGAAIFNDDLDIEFWSSAEAALFGAVGNGDAAGAGFAYDFTFTLAPFTTADIDLDPFKTYVYIESSPTDVGMAFAQAKLYQTDVDINDPGGANFPLASDVYSLQAGDPIIDTQPGFTNPFTNFTPSPVTYNLRFEASVSVLEVPEPAIGSSIALGALLLAGIGSSRQRRALSSELCP